MTNTIQREVRLPQSRERVWQALATSDGLAKWMYPNDFEPCIGRRFTFRVPPKPEDGFEGLVVECEVLECEPPRSLVFTWTTGGPVIDTRVSFRLESDGEGTRLYFEHSGFDLSKPWAEEAVQGAVYGWAEMFEKLHGVLTDTAGGRDAKVGP